MLVWSIEEHVRSHKPTKGVSLEKAIIYTLIQVDKGIEESIRRFKPKDVLQVLDENTN